MSCLLCDLLLVRFFFCSICFSFVFVLDLFSLFYFFPTFQHAVMFQVDDETNDLQDGTLIDLCGATLLWRSAEGLAKSPVSHRFVSCGQRLIFKKCPEGVVIFSR